MTSIYDFEVTTIDGKTSSLEDYKGKVILIVNTASKCGLTPQFKGLEELYQKYKDQGLVILGFPCNQFGHQEPGDEEQIEDFCQVNYGVTFPMHAKIDVNGSNTPPLFEHIKGLATGIMRSQQIKWNFTKFLINRDGDVLKRFSPGTTPSKIEPAIKKALAE